MAVLPLETKLLFWISDTRSVTPTTKSTNGGSERALQSQALSSFVYQPPSTNHLSNTTIAAVGTKSSGKRLSRVALLRTIWLAVVNPSASNRRCSILSNDQTLRLDLFLVRVWPAFCRPFARAPRPTNQGSFYLRMFFLTQRSILRARHYMG
jgi:hypothetical protein